MLRQAGPVKFRCGFDGEKFWAELVSIGDKSPDEFKRILNQITSKTGLGLEELQQIFLVSGELENLNFQTRWQTTSVDMSAEGNIRAREGKDLSDVLYGLSYYNYQDQD